MPELMRTAVTCIHNQRNEAGRCPEQGEIFCTAPEVRFACVDIESERCGCGYTQGPEQRQEYATARCAYCGDDVPAWDTVQIGGKTVCGDCVKPYCDSLYPAHGAAYLQENIDRYLKDESIPADSDELYLNWMLQSLSRAERVAVLQAVFGLEAACVGGEYVGRLERDYCLESDDWTEFVQRRS